MSSAVADIRPASPKRALTIGDPDIADLEPGTALAATPDDDAVRPTWAASTAHLGRDASTDTRLPDDISDRATPPPVDPPEQTIRNRNSTGWFSAPTPHWMRHSVSPQAKLRCGSFGPSAQVSRCSVERELTAYRWERMLPRTETGLKFCLTQSRPPQRSGARRAL